MKKLWFTLFATAAAIVMLPASPSASASPNSAQNTAQTSTPNGKRIYCLDGWERLLPGDYYACRARYHLQREHPAQAVNMLKEAAYWASKDAQHALGLAYVNGDIAGVHANRPLGIAWLALAAQRKNADYVRDYSLAVLRSSPRDISNASQKYVELDKIYGDKVAGKRAINRFVREVKTLDDIATQGGNSAYIQGLTPYPEGAFALSRKIHAQAEEDFEGLQGTVTVGMLERIQAPASPALRSKYTSPASEK